MLNSIGITAMALAAIKLAADEIVLFETKKKFGISITQVEQENYVEAKEFIYGEDFLERYCQYFCFDINTTSLRKYLTKYIEKYSKGKK